MSSVRPVSHKELIKRLRDFGFEGHFTGGKHLFMLKGSLRLTITNPHKKSIDIDLLLRIVKQAGIFKDDWTE